MILTLATPTSYPLDPYLDYHDILSTWLLPWLPLQPIHLGLIFNLATLTPLGSYLGYPDILSTYLGYPDILSILG